MKVSPLKSTEQYIDSVLDGTILTSKLVRLTVERHQRDLIEAHERGLRFDKKKAAHIIQFVESFCHHSKGEWSGMPFILMPWQRTLLAILFGWVHSDTGFRRFRFAYNELARGSGKSTLAAAVGLYLLVADNEGGAEIYAAATKKDQARIVHSEAVRMVKQSPALAQRITTFRDNLHIAGTASKFEPLASDEDSLDGLNIQGAIVDELHAHRDRKVWDVLITALGKRRQPLLFAITTAGTDRHSVCWEQHDYSEKVLTGIVNDDTWFAWIAGLDADDDWQDEGTWIKANPGLGHNIRIEELRAAGQKAAVTPGALNSFLRLRLNVWTSAHTAWMPMDLWDECNSPFDDELLVHRACFAGLDLSTSIDLTALVLVFPPNDSDPLWRVRPFFWVPAENVARRVQRDRVPYDVWIRQGLVETTPGNVIDDEAIRLKLIELRDRYDIREVAYDPWSALSLSIRLEADGFLPVPIRQGTQSLNAPMKKVAELVMSKTLAHDGNAVLRWNASNLMAHEDTNGNVKPDKAESKERIDGMSALITAMARAIVVPITPVETFAPFWV